MDAQLLPCREGEMRLERGVISPRLWSEGQSQGCLADSNTRLPSIVQSKGLSRVFSNTTLQQHQFFGA